MTTPTHPRAPPTGETAAAAEPVCAACGRPEPRMIASSGPGPLSLILCRDCIASFARAAEPEAAPTTTDLAEFEVLVSGLIRASRDRGRIVYDHPGDAAIGSARAALLSWARRAVERAEAAERERDEAAELVTFGRHVSPSLLDSVSDRDARILSAWAAVRAREAEQAKLARNAAESERDAARAEAKALREALKEIASCPCEVFITTTCGKCVTCVARRAITPGETR